MPKMKTHKGTAKRFRKTGTGKVMHAHPNKSHILAKKSPKRIRKFRQEEALSDVEAKRVSQRMGK